MEAHEKTQAIMLKIRTINDHGSRELVAITLVDVEGEGSMLQARKYDITRAGMKEGDSVILKIVPEYEDTIPDDERVVKIRAKVTFITSSARSLIPDVPGKRYAMIFLADWMPWILNPKITVQTKIARALNIKVGDIVKVILSK